MRLPGRLAAAIEVLEDVETRHRPAGVALKDWGTAHRFAGSGDRAAIGNLVYDALRRRASHAYAMGEDSARALILSVAVRDWGEDPQKLQSAFADDAHAPAPLSEQEQTRLSTADPLEDAPDHIRADTPDWLVSSLQSSFGENWIAEGQAMAQRPPLDMRVNTLKSNREKVLKSLKRFDPESLSIAPHGIRITPGTRDARTPNVQSGEAYLKGWCEIQDAGSQIVAALSGAEPGDQVLDICAGAGGKTLALAAAMDNKGQIFAYDADRSRLAPIYDRIKRNGVHNVQVRAPEEGALKDLQDKMDRVVVDAPCTGTGTWRRRPDTKWRLTPEQFVLRQSEQAAILDEAAAYVKPGGKLVYITCSLLPEENGDQIASFLKRHAGFTAIAPDVVWSIAGNPAQTKPYFGETGITLTPATCGTDGFFFAMLRRVE